VEEGDGGEGKILYRRDRPRWGKDEVPEEGEGGLALCERLASVKFSYLDTEGEETEDWDPSSEDEIPKLVSIAIEFLNPSDPEIPLKFATRVALQARGAKPGEQGE
jgi:hypothetical protein